MVDIKEADFLFDTSKFYDFIVKLSASSTDQEKFRRAYDELMRLVITGFHTNIQLAAVEGRCMAYLCIYEENAQYQNIKVHDYFTCVENIRAKCEKYSVEPLLERISKTIQPFRLELRNLSECIDIEMPQEWRFYAIIVCWDYST
jgi:hypothetical protein